MPKFITALDIGTTKICCLIGKTEGEEPLRIVGSSHTASAGLKNGVIIDMNAAKEAIATAVHAAEKMARVTIDDVVVSLTSTLSISHMVRREAHIGGGIVRDMHVRRLYREAQVMENAHDRNLIHAIPTSFDVDDAVSIPNPQGMHTQKLTLNMHLITSRASSIRNLEQCLSRCHLSLHDMVAEPYATGLAVLSKDEWELGATVIDMGGGATSIAIFHENALVDTANIPVGGGHVTNDIARILSTPLGEAEKLKTRHGSALPSPAGASEILEAPQIGEEEDTPHTIRKGDLSAIIAPRIEETFELVRDKLLQSDAGMATGRRVILTGGAALLPGIRERAAHILGRPVRAGHPKPVPGLAASISGPAFATAIGLLLFSLDNRGDARLAGLSRRHNSQGFWKRMGEWIRATF